jgi:chemotaxis protein methyltransferase CheR
MNSADFQFLSKMLVERSGISIGDDKQYLIETRLPKVARKHNINSIEELVAKLKLSPFSQMATDVIDAMTTNESLFFRDTKPFEQLKRIILPKFQNKMLNIWSAASSTGQEAYSTAITCEDSNFKSYNIVGTDISPTVVERAIEGKYSQFEVQRGLPIMTLVKYFTQSGTDWIVKPVLKEKIKFKNFNLMDSYSPLGKFDVVMCRNVLIYFEKETKRQVLDKIAQVINPGGYLFLGSSETIYDLSSKFKQVDGETGMFQLV